MSDEIPEALLPILDDLKAQAEMLQHAVVFLLTTTIPPTALDRYVERISVPVTADTPEATHAMHKAIGQFLDVLHQRRPIAKDQG